MYVVVNHTWQFQKQKLHSVHDHVCLVVNNTWQFQEQKLHSANDSGRRTSDLGSNASANGV